MSVQPISTPPVESNTKPFILSKVQWLGREISLLGKSLCSQLTKITHFFYQTIKKHPKKTLAILSGATITFLIYYKGKDLAAFLKSLKSDPQEKILKQKVSDLTDQFSKQTEELKTFFPILEKNIAAISISQTAIHDKCRHFTDQCDQIKKDLSELTKPVPDVQLNEKITFLESKTKGLQDLKSKVQDLVQETDDYKNNLSNTFNPFPI